MLSQVKQTDQLPQLPECLKMEDVAMYMGISRSTAFSLSKQPGFPAIRVGKKRIVVPKYKFIAWLDNQVEMKLNK